MSHTLTNYNGMQIVTPEGDLSADRQALNENFKAVADGFVRNPMTSNLDAGGNDITDIGTSGDNPALAVNAGSMTSLDGGAISTDGSGNFANGLSVQGKDEHSTVSVVVDASLNGGTYYYLASSGSGDGVLGGGWFYVGSPSGYVLLVSPAGNVLIGTTSDTGQNLQVGGSTSLDGGDITTDGSGNITACNSIVLNSLQLAAQGSPPTPVAGGIYFDGTNFKFCADGSTWVALTLP